LAAFPAVVAGMSWHAMAVAALAMLLVATVVCWAIADGSRTRGWPR
jgi:hypothetical protein